MAEYEAGFISSIANFLKDLPLPEALRQMESYEEKTEFGRELTQHLGAQFAALCNAALKALLAQYCPTLVTLRIEEGYGWVEGRKHWLRLGADIHVDESELDLAADVLENPIFAGVFDHRIEEATRLFVKQQLPPHLFGELSCSFCVNSEPEEV